VNGWAKNLDSGDVEVVLEGPRDAVDRVAAICRAGPPGARVTDVRITDEAPRGERGFSVR
jgi:acylphosphatase